MILVNSALLVVQLTQGTSHSTAQQRHVVAVVTHLSRPEYCQLHTPFMMPAHLRTPSTAQLSATNWPNLIMLDLSGKSSELASCLSADQVLLATAVHSKASSLATSSIGDFVGTSSAGKVATVRTA